IALNKRGNLRLAGEFEIVGQAASSWRVTTGPGAANREPFLRVPPFPGSKFRCFAETNSSPSEAADLIEQVRRLRVGGTYWGAQPELPSGHALVRSTNGRAAAAHLFGSDKLVVWEAADLAPSSTSAALTVFGECDPWHMLSFA